MLVGTTVLSGNWKRSGSSNIALAETPTVHGNWKRSATSVIVADSQLSYIGPHALAASSPLALTDAAHLCQNLAVSAASNLSVASSSLARGTMHVVAASALSPQSWADPPSRVRQLLSTIALSDAASPAYCHTASSQLALMQRAEKGQKTATASSAFSLSQASRLVMRGTDAASTLFLSHSVVTSIHMLAAGTTVSLSGAAACQGPKQVSAASLLQTTGQGLDGNLQPIVVIGGLQDAAAVAHTAGFATPVQYLDPRGAASVVRLRANAINLSAGSQLCLDYDIARNKTGDAQARLALDQSIAVHRCSPAASGVSLSDSALSTSNRGRGACSMIEGRQSVTFVVVTGSIQFQYHPFIGEGAAGIAGPPPATLPGPLAGITARFQLVWPAAGEATDSVTLRAPNLGNKDRLSFNRVSRETRGGTLIVFADPVWPKIQTLALSFSGLSEAESQDLLAFLEAHLGQEVGLIDWEQRYWRGVVMTPEEPVTEDSRGR